MGKKGKKKSRTPQKEKRAAANSQKKVSELSSPSVENVDEGGSVVKEEKSCPHLEEGIDLEALSAKIGSSEHVKCEGCREGAADRRGSKGNGKHGKKKGGASAEPESKAVWVCLKCGHYACGGVGLPTNPQCHTVRHTRLTCHPLVIQFEKPQLRWCFKCHTLVQVKKTEENGEQKDVFSDVVKLIKGRTSERPAAVNAEDVWFGSGNVSTKIKSAAAVPTELDGQCGYVASGLVNLGNTCFFNSVLQNLLAMDKLQDYFLKLDVSVGPLTMALKKLFAETKPESGSKNEINTRAVFGSVCSKASQFRGYQQHDSHELLRCILDGLSSEESGMKKQMNSSKENGNSSSPVPTFVDAVFGGQVSSTICCIECGHSSTVYESFLDLSLPVPTKKPATKKSQQASHGKKAKVPPKRSAKNRPKLNRSVESVSGASPSRELSCKPQSRSAVPTTAAEENGSVVHNSTPVEESQNKQVFEDEAEQTSALLDDSTWLDYLELEAPLDDHSWTSNGAADSIIHDTGNIDVLKNDLQVPESVEQVLPLNEEPNIKPQFSMVNPWEDEIPLQVQSSEVLLLPYKEESSAAVEFGEGGASSSIHGGGQEDFDGFGGLFDEPEVSTGPIMGPSMADEITETGFMAGISSDSDPDEVDDTDSPVSVETCLAHFTKPELLSNENAWHCENCSKNLRRQKLKANKQLKAAPKTLVNGCGMRTESHIVDSNKDPCPTEVRNNNNNFQRVAKSHKFDATINFSTKNHTAEENGQQDKMDPLVSQGEEGKAATKDAAQEQSNSSGSYYTCRQESLSDQAMDSTCADEAGSIGSINESVQQGESKLLTRNNQSEESEDDEINSETVKVKRDATKRVLINKAPPILTIHLKRFSQDARGRLSKLNGHVTFRETIDLKPYMDARCMDEARYVYRLVGVVEHSGTMRMGHYVAYVRGGGRNGRKDEKENDVGSAWFHASDDYVRETNLKEVLGCEAYILFYEKV